ncbi:hypothetical protein CTEN210_16644 [Chaetoceros tenuissimus]|uniref:Uncharacterized protein n=1 Tax=Chaetoceros tenuissimus TaxID=426638 RepID=A0AAD3HEL8_9STRA|nr:hypothetical protein CTEN210_16644 [Chaetoceros tenuissimus]
MHIPSSRKRICNGSSNSNSRITYQSRMSYLKSREGRSNKNLVGENKPSTFTFAPHLRPITPAKLLPPKQFMTKEVSFRHLYRRHHPPKKLAKMNLLTRKENPQRTKKREQIYAKIRASELAMEKMKHEKEIRQSNKNERKDTSEMSISERSISEISQDEGDFREPNITKKGVIVSGFVTEKRRHYNKSGNSSVSTNDDILGGNFSFLSDWKGI